MSDKKTTSATQPNDDTFSLSQFETTMEKITAIVTQLENQQLPLEDALKQFEKGTQMITQCQQGLQQAEQRIQLLKQQQLDAFPNDD